MQHDLTVVHVTSETDLIDNTLLLLSVEVTLARHIWPGLAGLVLLYKAGRATAAGVALAVLLDLVGAVAGVLALLATCMHCRLS